MSGPIRKRSRRKWSPEEKQRIVSEATRPGASIAEVARRYGINANLVFAWRRLLQPAAAAKDNAPARTLLARSDAPSSGTNALEFVPVGVFARSEDQGSELRAPAANGRVDAAWSARQERPGVIEIDLASGARVRVGALAGERALRRVLAALKASS